MAILCQYHSCMQKRSSKNVKRIAAIISRDTAGIDLRGKNPAAVALGRRGGLKGGKARALVLSDAERKEIARHAAEVRWRKERG
jgi:hypothetical protein